MDISDAYCCNHTRKEGLVWCFDCQTILCKECEISHLSSGNTNDHSLITIEQYAELPKYVLNNRCSYHDEKLEFFCKVHAKLCCMQCITKYHFECKEIDFFKKCASNIRTSFNEIQSHLDKLSDKINYISQNRKSNLTKIENKKISLVKDIQNFRNSINEHLDKLQTKILDELSKQHQNASKEIEKLLSCLCEEKKNIERIEMDVRKIKQHGADIHVFLGTKVLESKVEQIQMFLNDLEKDQKLDDVILKLKFDNKSTGFIENLTCLGIISIQKKSNKSVYQMKKKSRQVSDINCKRKTYIRIKSEKNRIITGCAILPGGQMIFVDFQNYVLIVHNKDGSHDRSIQLTGQPSDIVVIRERTLAVTLWTKQKIVVVNLDENKEVQHIDINAKCYGIEYHNNMFLVSLENSNMIQIYDTDWKLVTKVHLPTEGFSYVKQHENVIYCSNEGKNNILSCTLSGNLISNFKHSSLLNPHQLSVDKDGFIYVAGFRSNNVMVISPNGQNSRVLLEEEDGLQNPSAIVLKNDQLLICNAFSGEAHLYELS